MKPSAVGVGVANVGERPGAGISVVPIPSIPNTESALPDPNTT